MYLTIHRVESPDEPRLRAVHGYLYMHGEHIELGPVLFEEITVRDPGGELVDRDDDTPPPPGGNTVLSFLDIVTQDDADLADVRRQLESFSYEISAPELPMTQKSGPIWLKFHISTPTYMTERNAVAEYTELSTRAIELLERWRTSS